MTENDRCEISVLPHQVKGFELELKGDCADSLKVIEGLPPRKRGYLNRRLRVEA
jgi:hypothetical protein